MVKLRMKKPEKIEVGESQIVIYVQKYMRFFPPEIKKKL